MEGARRQRCDERAGDVRVGEAEEELAASRQREAQRRRAEQQRRAQLLLQLDDGGARRRAVDVGGAAGARVDAHHAARLDRHLGVQLAEVRERREVAQAALVARAHLDDTHQPPARALGRRAAGVVAAAAAAAVAVALGAAAAALGAALCTRPGRAPQEGRALRPPRVRPRKDEKPPFDEERARRLRPVAPPLIHAARQLRVELAHRRHGTQPLAARLAGTHQHRKRQHVARAKGRAPLEVFGGAARMRTRHLRHHPQLAALGRDEARAAQSEGREADDLLGLVEGGGCAVDLDAPQAAEVERLAPQSAAARRLGDRAQIAQRRRRPVGLDDGELKLERRDFGQRRRHPQARLAHRVAHEAALARHGHVEAFADAHRQRPLAVAPPHRARPPRSLHRLVVAAAAAAAAAATAAAAAGRRGQQPWRGVRPARVLPKLGAARGVEAEPQERPPRRAAHRPRQAPRLAPLPAATHAHRGCVRVGQFARRRDAHQLHRLLQLGPFCVREVPPALVRDLDAPKLRRAKHQTAAVVAAVAADAVVAATRARHDGVAVEIAGVDLVVAVAPLDHLERLPRATVRVLVRGAVVPHRDARAVQRAQVDAAALLLDAALLEELSRAERRRLHDALLVERRRDVGAEDGAQRHQRRADRRRRRRRHRRAVGGPPLALRERSRGLRCQPGCLRLALGCRPLAQRGECRVRPGRYDERQRLVAAHLVWQRLSWLLARRRRLWWLAFGRSGLLGGRVLVVI